MMNEIKGKPLWVWIDEFDSQFPNHRHRIVCPGSPAEDQCIEERHWLTPLQVVDTYGTAEYRVYRCPRYQWVGREMNPIKDFVQRLIGRWRLHDVTDWQEYPDGSLDVCCELDSTINTLIEAFPDDYLVLPDWDSGVVTIGKLKQGERR